MKILALSDIESRSLWDFYDESKLKGIDLILSCGDLSAEYLSFIVTMARCPVLYVHGNHDVKYDIKPPEGCICIEDSVYEYKGVRILGLGGSYFYGGKKHQYTERQMRKRVSKMKWRRKLSKKKSIDIILTHSPAFESENTVDTAHKGFQVFNELIKEYKPKFFVHGHVHMNYGSNVKRLSQMDKTIVVNAYEKYCFEF